MNRHFVDYNAIPAPCVQMADPPKTPSQIATEQLEKARKAAQAKDAEAYKSMTPPASASKPREQPYRPGGFDFQYHGPKGLSGEVIKRRPEPSGFKDAFEVWLSATKPAGDCEAVQSQWEDSWARADFLEQEGRQA
jgi:hypothetical protein